MASTSHLPGILPPLVLVPQLLSCLEHVRTSRFHLWAAPTVAPEARKLWRNWAEDTWGPRCPVCGEAFWDLLPQAESSCVTGLATVNCDLCWPAHTCTDMWQQWHIMCVWHCMCVHVCGYGFMHASMRVSGVIKPKVNLPFFLCLSLCKYPTKALLN